MVDISIAQAIEHEDLKFRGDDSKIFYDSALANLERRIPKMSKSAILQEISEIREEGERY